ncbi:MAG TPA: hypothetical protein VFQ24_14690 [Terriglobia bacterium]|nr:hypothetical protein [Terriglobia bacterium]
MPAPVEFSGTKNNEMGQKNTFFEKQTGEVVEKKEKLPKNKPERTGKQSGEVVENT